MFYSKLMAQEIIEKIKKYAEKYNHLWQNFDDTFINGVESSMSPYESATLLQINGLYGVLKSWEIIIKKWEECEQGEEIKKLPNNNIVSTNKKTNNTYYKVFKSSNKNISKNKITDFFKKV